MRRVFILSTLSLLLSSCATAPTPTPSSAAPRSELEHGADRVGRSAADHGLRESRGPLLTATVRAACHHFDVAPVERLLWAPGARS